MNLISSHLIPFHPFIHPSIHSFIPHNLLISYLLTSSIPPVVLCTWAPRSLDEEILDEEKSKHAGLAQQNGFGSAPAIVCALC
jgi:hypothetical protein